MNGLTFYGRRICKCVENGKIIFRWSGQWIGHRKYGNEFGTQRQRKNVSTNIVDVSKKIFWNYSATAGQEVEVNSNPAQYFLTN